MPCSDRSTQVARRPDVDRLAAYRRPLLLRPSWHLLIVVPGLLRADWMVRQGVAVDLGERAWVVTHNDLARDSLDSLLRPLDPRLPPSPIGRSSSHRGGFARARRLARLARTPRDRRR